MLPAVISPVDAMAPDAPLLFPDLGSNICFGTTFPEEGEVDPLAGADAVAEVTMVSRAAGRRPMETNCILAVPTDGLLTCWVSIRRRTPFAPRTPRCSGSNLPSSRRVRVGRRWLRPQIGSVRRAPGGRGHHAEAGSAGESMAPRSEDMVSLVHGRDFVMTAKLGVRADGKIVGLDASVVASCGAYPGLGRDPSHAHR